MATTPAWQPLPVLPSTGLPNLLVSTTFTETAYSIRVTDLANIWVESMDRKAIWRRSLNESTSIDPTDSENNMRAFLSKIRSVFDASHEDHVKASMALSMSPNRDAGEGGLTLRITCELDNMKPLGWPVYLRKCPQSKLATELVVPLVQASNAKSRQVDSLLSIVKQKDTIITKLLDKLEATGTRLENVFTVLSAKQKPTMQMAEEKVKGLAPFRLDDWKSQLDCDDEDISNLLRDVFGASGLAYRQHLEMDDSVLDDWWTKTESSDIQIVGPKSEMRQTQTGIPSPERKHSDHGARESTSGKTEAEDDGEFQIQSTPPHLMSANKRRAKEIAAQNDATVNKVASQEPKSHAVRLGTIGEKGQNTSSRNAPPSTKVSQPAESETETESDEDATASLAEDSSPPHPDEPPLAAKNARGGLGRIGGGRSRSKTPESTWQSEATVRNNGSPKKHGLGRIGGYSHRSKSPEPPKKGGIGRIGGGRRPSKTPEPPVAETEDRGRSRTETRPQEQPRETSQERADRKRDELQRELQRKAASGPARKKRKF